MRVKDGREYALSGGFDPAVRLVVVTGVAQEAARSVLLEVGCG